jgi:hypothetical protein
MFNDIKKGNADSGTKAQECQSHGDIENAMNFSASCKFQAIHRVAIAIFQAELLQI